jgi:hypothetical protein
VAFAAQIGREEAIEEAIVVNNEEVHVRIWAGFCEGK